MPNRVVVCRVLVAVSTLLIQGCVDRTSQSPRLFVSESLPNRVQPHISGTAFGAHDSLCVGFLSDTFDPTTLNSSIRSTNELTARTGLEWRDHASTDSVLDLTAFSDETENRVVFVMERIGPRPAGTVLSLGSDDGIRVWVNGEEVYMEHGGRELGFDDGLIEVSLTQPSNVILYKVDQGDGGWALARRFLSPSQAAAVIDSLTARMYEDLVESAIVPDTIRQLAIRPDGRRTLDSRDARFRWLNIDGSPQPLSQAFTHPSRDLPRHIPLPDRLPALLEVRVGSYLDLIPVFSESRAAETADMLASNPKRPTAHRQAVSVVMGLRPPIGGASSRKYSTRFRADVLASVAGAPLTATVGHYTAAAASRPFRAFVPRSTGQTDRMMLLTYGEAASPSFWAGKEAGSHALTTQWSSIAATTGVPIALMHGHGSDGFDDALREIPRELARNQIVSAEPSVSGLAFSTGADRLVQSIIDRVIRFDRVGLIVPVLSDPSPEDTARRLWEAQPDIRWFIRAAMNDSDVPIHQIRRWAAALESAGYSVDYKEMPHSSHWVWLGDPVHDFATAVAG